MLYNKTLYTAPIEMIGAANIYEYDISKANINILFKYNKINKDLYLRLSNSDRLERQIYIGLMIKSNPDIGKIIKNGILEAKKGLFELNNINDIDILSIKNDAVFLINKVPSITNIDGIIFENKNIYNSFYTVNNLELYYRYDPVNLIDVLDVKGISDDNLKLHQDYFADLLKHIFSVYTLEGKDSAVYEIAMISSQYNNKLFGNEYYRSFDYISKYRYVFGNYITVSDMYLDTQYDEYLDYYGNLSILNKLYSLYIKYLN